MEEHNTVSHADIYHKLGELQGTVQSLVVNIGERRVDSQNILIRMAQLESKVALVFGGCAVLAFVVPLIVTLTTINYKQQTLPHPMELKQ